MLERFLSPVFGGLSENEVASSSGEWVLMAISAAIAGTALLGAWWVYLRAGVDRARVQRALSPLHRLLSEGYFVERLYGALFVWPLVRLGEACATSVDLRRIDGAVNGTGRFILGAASLLRQLQTGFVRNYALAILAGAVVILAYLIVRR